MPSAKSASKKEIDIITIAEQALSGTVKFIFFLTQQQSSQ